MYCSTIVQFSDIRPRSFLSCKKLSVLLEAATAKNWVVIACAVTALAKMTKEIVPLLLRDRGKYKNKYGNVQA